MIRGLLAKELRQHALTLAFLFLLLIGGLALIAGNTAVRRAGGGGFAALRFVHLTFVPLTCLVLGQVLIALEFRQKTQLFLEGLPLPRWRMLAVKFVLGLGVVLLAVATALLAAWWRARGTEAMTPRFAALLALKSAGWVWFSYTLFFAWSFLGRYRVVFGTLLLFSLLYMVSSGVRVSAFGPFALIDDRFPFERHIVPMEALAVAGGLGLVQMALGFALGLVRDASVASLLAEKMSSREKVFMTFVTIAAMMVATFLHDRYRTSTLVLMPGAIEVQRGLVNVQASAAVDAPEQGEIAALESLAPRIADELSALVEYLGCESFPAIFIVHRRDLGANKFTSGGLKREQGALVRVNVTAKDFDPIKLERWLVRESLLAHTSDFAGRERSAWVLEGIAWWWPERALLATPLPEAERAAMPADFSAKQLNAWFTVRKKAGEREARMLAATGLAAIIQCHGADACRRFLSSMLGQHRPHNFRGWLADVARSRSSRLRAATGVSEEVFVQEWRATLSQPEPVK